MLGNTGRSIMVISTPPWTYLWNLVVWTRQKSNLHNQKIIWEDHERGWLPLWVSRPLEGQRKPKRQGFPLLMSVLRIFLRILRKLRSCLMRVIWGRGPIHAYRQLLISRRQLVKCMMIFNLRIEPVITLITNTQRWMILRWVRKIFRIWIYVLRTRTNQKG